MSIPVQSDIVGFQNIGKGPDAVRLPDLDLHAWIDVLRQLPAVPVTEKDLLAWVDGPLRRFFPFAKFWGAYGSLAGGRILMRSLMSSGHTPEFLAYRERTFAMETRGCFAWWVRNRKAFLLDKTGGQEETGTRIPATTREFHELELFSLGTVAAHGVIDPFMNTGTYFSFCGVPRTQPSRTLAALDLIVPVLHMLYLQTKQLERSSVDLTVLTDRQRDLVDLALMGLSDKAIAARLEISDHTVGNHFRAIYAKLGISKRSQLIALLK
jgi:DNA-binding CsgD family transcriptional regulator